MRTVKEQGGLIWRQTEGMWRIVMCEDHKEPVTFGIETPKGKFNFWCGDQYHRCGEEGCVEAILLPRGLMVFSDTKLHVRCGYHGGVGTAVAHSAEFKKQGIEQGCPLCIGGKS